MNISKQQIDDLNAIVTIEIGPDDYTEKVEKALEDYRKNAKIPGFRPGKVPAGLVKRQFGKSMLINEVDRLLQDSLYKYLTDEKLDILGNPLPVEQTDINWELGGTFSFAFELGLSPEFELKVNKKVKMPMYSIVPNEDVVNEEVTNLARRYGKMSEVETAGADDVFFGTFAEKVENGVSRDGRFALTAISDKKVAKAVSALKVGESIDLSKSSFVADFNLAGVLGLTDEQLAATSDDFTFTVKNIYHTEPAELNQELFDKLFGPNEVTSEEQLREKISEELVKLYSRDANTVFMNKVSEHLMSTSEFTLPETFLKKWMQTAGERKLSAEEVELQWPSMVNSLKWQLIENKVVKDNHLHVHREELVDFAKNLVRERLQSFGQMPEEADLESIAMNVLKDQEQAQQMNEQLLNDKMLNFFKDAFKLEEKEVSYADFLKLVNEQN